MITRNFLFTAPCEVEWEEHEVNDQPGPGQVLVEAHSSVISAGTDVSIYSGTHKNINNPDAPWPKYPHRPGGHVAGTVLAVGEGISELREGDRIVFGGQYTRFHVLEPAISQLQKLPEEVSFAEAVLARHSTVSLHGIRTSRMTLGERGVVLGLGLIGQYAVQYAKVAGADKVIGVDPIERRRDIAQQCGADIILDPAKNDVASRVISITEGEGADVVIEATGAPEVIPTAMKAARQFGRVVLLGSPRGNVEIDPYNDLHRKGIHVIGSNPQPRAASPYYPWTLERNLAFALDLVATGRLQLDKLISHRLRAEDSLNIWEMLAHKPAEYLGVILEWTT